MPRVEIKDYRKKDFIDTILSKMAVKRIKQRQLAGAMGIEQSTLSKKLYNGNFTFDETLIIMDYLSFTNDEILKITKR